MLEVNRARVLMSDLCLTVKPVLAVTSNKKPPAFKGQYFVFLFNCKLSCIMQPPVFEGHFTLSFVWPLNTCLTVFKEVWICAMSLPEILGSMLVKQEVE